MRILCVAAYYKPARVYGGPTRSVSALCEGLAKAGEDVTVFTTNANGSDTLAVSTGKALQVDGVNVYYYPVASRIFKRLPFYFYSPGLARACAEQVFRFDVVYVPGNWTHSFWAGAKAANHNNVPYVVSPRGCFMDWSMQQRYAKKRIYLELFERRLIDHAAAIQLTSEMEAGQTQKWQFTPPPITIPSGIDLAAYRNLPPRGKLRQTLGLYPDDRLALFVGRIHKEKRPLLMIKAFSRVAQMDSKAHLLVVGPDQDGSLAEMVDLAGQSGLSERVHFIGLLGEEDLLQAYTDADLLVLLSHRENFGMVLVEGMAAGLPTLMSEEVGLAKEIQESGAGAVVQATPEIVSREWSRLMNDLELRQQMGMNGRKLAEERFSEEIVVEQMRGLFRSVIN